MTRESAPRGAYGLLALVVLITSLPFAGKAFHVDEVYFIEVAQRILADPWRPFSGAVALEDLDYRVFAAAGRCPNTYESMSHPPLVAYAVALVSRLAGGFFEAPLHVAFAAFALLAAAAFYALSRRFTRQPSWSALLLVSSPIFILSESSLTTDLPALALSLAALALLVRGVDDDSVGLVRAAGLFAGLAVLTRYAAALVVPLLLGYGLLRNRLRAALPMLWGLGVSLGAWALQNLSVHGQLHVIASARHYAHFYEGQSFGWDGLLKKALGDASGLGGTTFVAGVLLLAVPGARRRWVFVVASLAAAAVFVTRPAGIERLETYSPREVAAVACCVGLGTVLLAEGLAALAQLRALHPSLGAHGDDAFLALWLALVVAGSLLILPFGTARYLLPALPPLWLLLVRRAASLPLDERTFQRAAACVVAQGLILGVCLAASDRELADGYRDVSATLRARYPEQRLWFVGEWGFRYYMARAGARYLRSADESPERGDVIVRPWIAGMHEMSPSVRARSERRDELRLTAGWPIRLMSFDAKAGYYSHHWGFLPFALSRAPLEIVEIFEVVGPAPSTIPQPGTCASF